MRFAKCSVELPKDEECDTSTITQHRLQGRS